MNIFTGISDEVRDAIYDVSHLHPAQIILRRKKWLHKWLCLAKDLGVEDEKMKSGASPERLVILKPKRLALLKNIIAAEGYPDTGLADDIARGFDLVGKIPQSGTLPKKFSLSIDCFRFAFCCSDGKKSPENDDQVEWGPQDGHSTLGENTVGVGEGLAGGPYQLGLFVRNSRGIQEISNRAIWKN